MDKKKTNLKSPWRCMWPLLVYLLIQYVATMIVMVVYCVQQGFMEMTNMSVEELTNQMMVSLMNDLTEISYTAMLVGYVIMVPVFWYMYHKDKKKSIMEGTYQKKAAVPVVFYLFVMIAGGAVCLAGSNMITMSGVAGISESYAETSAVLYSSGLWGELIGLGILAPLTEELLFRGLVYKRMREGAGSGPSVIWAMIWSSLIFALLHGNLVQGIYAFVVGILMCYAYERYGSLKAAIIMHISANIIAVIASETTVFDFMYSTDAMFYTTTFICGMIAVGMVYMIEWKVRPVTAMEETTANIEQNEQ